MSNLPGASVVLETVAVDPLGFILSIDTCLYNIQKCTNFCTKQKSHQLLYSSCHGHISCAVTEMHCSFLFAFSCLVISNFLHDKCLPSGTIFSIQLLQVSGNWIVGWDLERIKSIMYYSMYCVFQKLLFKTSRSRLRLQAHFKSSGLGFFPHQIELT